MGPKKNASAAQAKVPVVEAVKRGGLPLPFPPERFLPDSGWGAKTPLLPVPTTRKAWFPVAAYATNEIRLKEKKKKRAGAEGADTDELLTLDEDSEEEKEELPKKKRAKKAEKNDVDQTSAAPAKKDSAKVVKAKGPVKVAPKKMTKEPKKAAPKKDATKIKKKATSKDDDDEDAPPSDSNPKKPQKPAVVSPPKKKKNGYEVVEDMLKERRKREREELEKLRQEERLERKKECFLCRNPAKTLSGLHAHLEKAHRDKFQQFSTASFSGEFAVKWPYRWDKGDLEYWSEEVDGSFESYYEEGEEEKYDENTSPILVRFDGQIFALFFEGRQWLEYKKGKATMCEDVESKRPYKDAFLTWVKVIGDATLAKRYAVKIKFVSSEYEVRHLKEKVFSILEDSMGSVFQGNSGWIADKNPGDEEEEVKKRRFVKRGMLDFVYKIRKL